MTEYVFNLSIAGAKGTAKGVQYQARPEDTVTGINWTLSGELAKAVAMLIDSKQRPITEWREARRAFLALPAGHADARAALNRLSEAEDRLYNAT